MFKIEYVIVQRRHQLGVVERMVSGAHKRADAEFTATSLLDKVRREHPKSPPDGYQILDIFGRVVLRSWERQR
jgi:hypothetical protein